MTRNKIFTEPASTAASRYARQEGIITQEIIQQQHPVVVGCGAVGRQVAIILATMGFSRITLVDPDEVEEVNIGSQGFRTDSVGMKKALECRYFCSEVLGTTIPTAVPEYFAPAQIANLDSPDILCCVDSMSARKQIWDWCKAKAGYYGDIRMSADVLRSLSATADPEYYETTLHTDEEGYQDRCTSRTTFYGASCAGSIMVAEYIKHLRGMPTSADVQFNLLSMKTLDLQRAALPALTTELVTT